MHSSDLTIVALAIGAIGSCFVPESKASDVYFHFASYHPTKQYFVSETGENVLKINQVNPGIGLSKDIKGHTIEGGFYLNSEYNFSSYVQKVSPIYENQYFNIGLSYGIVSGYSRMYIAPLCSLYTNVGPVRVMFLPDPVIPAFGLSLKF